MLHGKIVPNYWCSLGNVWTETKKSIGRPTNIAIYDYIAINSTILGLMYPTLFCVTMHLYNVKFQINHCVSVCIVHMHTYFLLDNYKSSIIIFACCFFRERCVHNKNVFQRWFSSSLQRRTCYSKRRISERRLVSSKLGKLPLFFKDGDKWFW